MAQNACFICPSDQWTVGGGIRESGKSLAQSQSPTVPSPSARAILASLHTSVMAVGGRWGAGEDHRALHVSARSFPLAEAPDMRMTHVQELEGEL